jgi:hypothetical protein
MSVTVVIGSGLVTPVALEMFLGMTFFTGEGNFVVQEIEVFEVTD